MPEILPLLTVLQIIFIKVTPSARMAYCRVLCGGREVRPKEHLIRSQENLLLVWTLSESRFLNIQEFCKLLAKNC